jgi:hypothetical protein
MAGEEQLNPETVAVAQQAIEQDLAFEALADAEVQALYEELINNAGPIPSFEEADLDITSEVQQAAQFLVELMTEQ